jgi:hypothetical protein
VGERRDDANHQEDVHDDCDGECHVAKLPRRPLRTAETPL